MKIIFCSQFCSVDLHGGGGVHVFICVCLFVVRVDQCLSLLASAVSSFCGPTSSLGVSPVNICVCVVCMFI